METKIMIGVLDMQEEIKFVTELVELEIILSDAYILCIDTETRPSFLDVNTKYAWYPTSIIQIAVRTTAEIECVIIIDLIDFSNDKRSLSQLDKILSNVMGNVDIVKVGLGLENDLRDLCISYPTLSAFRHVPSIIDVNALFRYLQPDMNHDTSLKKLASKYLQHDLAKTMQCSDWAKRPLSSAQMNYALKDALVLLRLYDAMSCKAMKEDNFNLTLLMKRFQNGVENKPLKKKIASVTAERSLRKDSQRAGNIQHQNNKSGININSVDNSNDNSSKLCNNLATDNTSKGDNSMSDMISSSQPASSEALFSIDRKPIERYKHTGTLLPSIYYICHSTEYCKEPVWEVTLEQLTAEAEWGAIR
jgi:hypothetical protein